MPGAVETHLMIIPAHGDAIRVVPLHVAGDLGVGRRNTVPNAEVALTSTSSHELCEAIIDAVPGQGWDDDHCGEIGGICAWKTKQVGAGIVQSEWSSALRQCVQGRAGPGEPMARTPQLRVSHIGRRRRAMQR